MSLGQDGWLKTVGDAVGLLAGIVGLAYLLGGVILLLRLLVSKHSAEQAVSVIADAPKEFVITLGFVQSLGSAALVGIVAALIGAGINRPRNTSVKKLTDPSWLLWVLGALAVGVTGMSAGYFALTDGFRVELFVFAPLAVITFAAACAGVRTLRWVGTEIGSVRARAAITGLAWMTIAVPLTTTAGAFVQFQHVRVCVKGYATPRYAGLITTDADRVLLTTRRGRASGERTLVTFPAGSITRIDSGDVPISAKCPDLT